MEKADPSQEKQIYHLYIVRKCSHRCKLCCNKLYDIEKLPVITVEQLKTAHTVCLTGGDPMLIKPNRLIDFCTYLRQGYPNIQKLYVYTSGTIYLWPRKGIIALFRFIDGLSVCPKSNKDWGLFKSLLCNKMPECNLKSNRLYVLPEQQQACERTLQSVDPKMLESWNIIGRVWDKEFKTPENEHFVRLPILLK